MSDDELQVEPIQPPSQQGGAVSQDRPIRRTLRVTRRDHPPAVLVVEGQSGQNEPVPRVVERGPRQRGVQHKSGRGANARGRGGSLPVRQNDRLDQDVQHAQEQGGNVDNARQRYDRGVGSTHIHIHTGPEPGNQGPQPAGPERRRFNDDPLFGTVDDPSGAVVHTDWTLEEPWVPLPWWAAVVGVALPLLVGIFVWIGSSYNHDAVLYSAVFWLTVLTWLFAVFVCGFSNMRNYRWGGPFHHYHMADVRPDSNAMLDLRHVPRYGMVNVILFVAWFGIEIPGSRWLWQTLEGVKTLYVSFEMVAQLATDNVMALSATEKVFWLRLNTAARGLHTVNYDKWLAVAGINVKQDTVQYVLALYKRMQAEAVEDFPDPVDLQ